MIEFDCPACGEPLEISEHMAGRRVRCLECDDLIEVPEDCPALRRRRDRGLSRQQFVLFTILFLLIPAANVWVSSILYYAWRRSHPRKAKQINLLGFAVFGIHVLLVVVILVLTARISGRRPAHGLTRQAIPAAMCLCSRVP